MYKHWESFCKKLNDNGIQSVTAASILKKNPKKPFLILKHDVETNPLKALRLAEIESKHSHKGSYYVQAYLLNNKRNIEIFKKIQSLGHEVSYHHDVMDSNKGNLKGAKKEFQKYINIFEKNNFHIETVCQHGNPVVKRDGYYSNRDFFRDPNIAQTYSHISEIMVDFKKRINKEYQYISDAGYGWKIIYDPENNDIIESSEKNIELKSLNEVLSVTTNNDTVVSTHPHRWERNLLIAVSKGIVFRTVRFSAKSMLKVPLLKKVMEKFYFLAKKI